MRRHFLQDVPGDAPDWSLLMRPRSRRGVTGCYSQRPTFPKGFVMGIKGVTGELWSLGFTGAI